MIVKADGYTEVSGEGNDVVIARQSCSSPLQPNRRVRAEMRAESLEPGIQTLYEKPKLCYTFLTR
jgi:hypothetical protein